MSGTVAIKINNFNPPTDPWEERRLDTCVQVMTIDGALHGARAGGGVGGHFEGHAHSGCQSGLAWR